jgi:DNA-binding NtrC family response regulator
VERLVLLAEGEKVSAEDVQLALPASRRASLTAVDLAADGMNGTLAVRTEAFEKEVLLAELRRHNFHMTNVARSLGLERSHLYKKCQQLGIDLQTLRRPE